MRGKIENIDKGNKKITIKGQEYQIGKKTWNAENLEQNLEVGLEIEYEIKGANFDFKRIVYEKSQNSNSNKGFFENNQKNSPSIVFDYPYNFVRFGEKVFRKEREKGNISGTLECSLVNHSPLFIPGLKKDNGRGHSMEYFLEESSKYIIPGSSLKGTFRTVLEAISNSCIVNIEEERLEERKTAGEFNDRKYGIIKRLPTAEEDGLIIEADVVRISHEALNQYRNGKDLKVGFYSLKFSHAIYQYVSNDIDQNKRILNNLSTVTDKDDIEGTLWISANIFKKNKEKIIIPRKTENRFKLSFEEYENINYILKQRVEREKKEGKKFPIDELKVGDPIIFQDDMSNSKNLAISEIPRLRYKYSPHDLLDKELHSCKTIENACAACRIFGMAGEQKDNENKKINSMSKVFISDAFIPKSEAKIQNEPKLIKSLGEPHPTLTSFYLNKGDYNSKSNLRGRKFYWHHKDKINKDTNGFYNSIKAEKEEKHNSSIQFMNYGNEFKFTIRFENMTEEEFGLLLYTIELEDNMLHKVGKAKAFGFGSCKVKIKEIRLDETNKYSLDNFINKKNFNIDKNNYIKISKDTYLYDNSNQDKDLKLIMSSINKLDFSKSPFPEAEIPGKPQRGNNTLNWFMNMKRDKNFKLPIIQEYK